MKKYIYKKEKERKTPEVRACTFEKKTHLTKSSWKMPKTSDVSLSCKLFGISFESKGSLVINSIKIRPCYQVLAGPADPWHHCMALNQESFTWLYTKVQQSIAILQRCMWLVPRPYISLAVQSNRCLNKIKGGGNPRTLISVDWLNVKRLHFRHSKMVKWLDQTEHTLWGSSRRDLQKR